MLRTKTGAPTAAPPSVIAKDVLRHELYLARLSSIVLVAKTLGSTPPQLKRHKGAR